ncbi:MAG: P27 family phage terminase small subunit [Dorea sp.]|nr:P27 family phage terminase small subunit [Dorea sp.]
MLGVIKRETVRKRVKKSLIEQLESKGADVDIFIDQINDYMTMWDLKENLKDDILKNGLRMMYKTANGGKAEKDNPSVKQLPAVNKQMLMLLKQMDISTDKAVKGGGDSCDAL